MNMYRWIGSILVVGSLACPAWARWGVGVGFGYRPYGYCRPYYGYGWGYYPPVVIGVGAPVVYPPPVVIQQVPVATPVYASPPPPTAAAPVATPASPQPAPPAALPLAPVPVSASAPASTTASQAEIDRCLAHLANPDEKARADALVHLGRIRATQAVDSMTRLLNSDRSATVREAAARGLGLIGSPSAVPALQQAAQSDDDRDVRTSARFAVEVIQSRNH